jgi:hypothetical protein
MSIITAQQLGTAPTKEVESIGLSIVHQGYSISRHHTNKIGRLDSKAGTTAYECLHKVLVLLGIRVSAEPFCNYNTI